MIKKYSYEIEFLARELSPHGTKFYSASGDCSLKEIKESFKDLLKKYNFTTKGTATNGSILNAKGQVIGNFSFSSKTIQ